MATYPDPLANFNSPPGFKRWPRNWHNNNNVDSYLLCPACGIPLGSDKEVQIHINHYEASNDALVKLLNLPQERLLDTNFKHRILQAMCKMTKCPEPECSYVRTPRIMSNGEIDTDIKAFVEHEATTHFKGHLWDIGRFIGLIRDNREIEFGGGREIWPELFEYYKRNIRAHPDFVFLDLYLTNTYGSRLTNSRLDQLAKEWRLRHFADDFPGASEEDQRKYEYCYPFKIVEFLRTFHRPNDPQSEGYARYAASWDIMIGGLYLGRF